MQDAIEADGVPKYDIVVIDVDNGLAQWDEAGSGSFECKTDGTCTQIIYK